MSDLDLAAGWRPPLPADSHLLESVESSPLPAPSEDEREAADEEAHRLWVATHPGEDWTALSLEDQIAWLDRAGSLLAARPTFPEDVAVLKEYDRIAALNPVRLATTKQLAAVAKHLAVALRAALSTIERSGGDA